MRVKISQTIEVTDQQRADIGQLLGKKQASRDECRDFIWKYGADWALLVTRAGEYQEDLAGADFMGSALGIEPEPDPTLAELL